MNKFVLA
ncbi:electron transport complex, RnfABCDGE type, C subunit, partial [Vibrio parahaemolyticus EKP-026]